MLNATLEFNFLISSCEMNSSDEHAPLTFNEGRTTSEIIEIAYHLLAIAVGVPANIWALVRYYRIWKFRRSHRRTVILGVNLTVANAFILLIYSPNHVIWLLNVDWRFGSGMCKMFMFLRLFSHQLSSNSIVIIAIDMCLVLNSKLRTLMTSGRRRVYCLILFSLSVAFLCSVPQLYTWGLVTIPGTEGKKQCVFLYDDSLTFSTGYQLFHLLSVFYAPLTFIVISYVLCAFKVWKNLRKSKHLQQHQLNIAKKVKRESEALTLNRRKSSSNRRYGAVNSKRIKRKMFITSASVICLYVISWLPYQTIALWNTVAQLNKEEDLFESGWSEFVIWMEALQICTACLTPVLYTVHGL